MQILPQNPRSVQIIWWNEPNPAIGEAEVSRPLCVLPLPPLSTDHPPPFPCQLCGLRLHPGLQPTGERSFLQSTRERGCLGSSPECE